MIECIAGPASGTRGGYGNHRCRCEACTAANTAAVRDYLRRNPHQVIRKRDYMRARRARWRAAGRCIQCGRQASDGRSRCQKCLAAAARRNRG
ncbi:MAG: hypothetical protein OXG43_01620 [Chloroflexi bacterium]|nr:hypothetical protein [Chloroflexota bacterium]